ncbi:Nup85 nucleoporin-domain-containing protein [Ephemerocybe angulata]|uniref:Nuclear pore complex protein Nup85 n=1 Tax=Ephemerocybe angulata TaxID=980116 RepID=A0A8H6HUG5_9AGAR|nr:Nup85 nucleoporin-domain-containing protein [Tulosesus angulatus]
MSSLAIFFSESWPSPRRTAINDYVKILHHSVSFGQLDLSFNTTMDFAGTYTTVPALVESGAFSDLVEKGQTISAAQSPLDGSINLFVTPTNDALAQAKKPERRESEEQPIYFINPQNPPSEDRRMFLADTFLIFSALQKLLNAPEYQQPSLLGADRKVALLRKLAIDFVNFIKESWIHASQPLTRPGGPPQFSSDHYRSLYTCFSLFVVLFLPEEGYEQAPVGDELMEWLNTHFIEPSTEEGDHLSSLDRPWEDETFWPYLTRSILRGLNKASTFFLEALSKHPSEDLFHLTETMIPLIESQPRLQNFHTERDFTQSYRRWKDRVKALRIDLDRVPEERRSDDFENWWERMSDIVGILEGRSDVVKRVCEELGGDWKEVCVAWGIFVDPRLRRQDLFDTAAEVLDEMEADPTNFEDSIHAAMFSGDFTRVLEYSPKLDLWLSAHLVIFMEALGLLDVTNLDGDMSIRDATVLDYAEYLYSDPALWRITTHYMYSCDEIGKQRGDTLLTHIPLRLRQHTTDTQTADRIRSGDVVGVLKDVNEVCLQYNREGVRRSVCKIAARIFIQEKNYGLAASYCTSAEDWIGLGHIIDYVLEEYVEGSPSFVEHASAIAPISQKLGPRSNVGGVFFHRLLFCTRYARFHELLQRQDFSEAAFDLVSIFQSDVAPTAWWAVVLCDAVQLLDYEPALLFSSAQASMLLRKLEEISVRVAHGAGSDYLGVLVRMCDGKDESEALKRLKLVRLSLARYFAKCTVLDA